MQKLCNIQMLRAIAVLMVVALHLLAIEIKYNGFEEVLLPSFLRIGLSGVDLFFVISGFIMVTVTGNVESSPSRRSFARQFFWLRLSRVYPLYWFVSAAILAVYLNHRSFMNLPHFDLEYALRSFLLFPQPSLPILMVGWSLIHEIYFYLVFAGLLLLPRKHLHWYLLAWLLVVMEGSRHVDPFHPEQNQFLRIAFSPVTAEFIAGGLLALLMQHHRQHETSQPFPFAWPLFLLGCISLPVIWHFFSFNTAHMDVIGWTRVILFTAPFVLMVYGAVALEHNHQYIASATTVRIGDASYSIYLTHILILSACGRVWQLVATQGLFDNALAVSVMVVATLAGGWLCFRLVEKPMLDWCRRYV